MKRDYGGSEEDENPEHMRLPTAEELERGLLRARRRGLRRSIIFWTDTGACLSVLVRDLVGDPDITVTEEEAREAILKARDEGYLRGDETWLKVTDKGWEWWKKQPGVGANKVEEAPTCNICGAQGVHDKRYYEGQPVRICKKCIELPINEILKAKFALEKARALPPMSPPRRCRIDHYVPAEQAIYDAIQAVEVMGADLKLTEAVNLLGQAKDLIADYVDQK